jgi:hypothetical protein
VRATVDDAAGVSRAPESVQHRGVADVVAGIYVTKGLARHVMLP